MGSEMGKMGFNSLKFNTADVVLDGGVGGSAPASSAFMLNCDYIFWRPHRDRDMTPLIDLIGSLRTRMRWSS